MARSQVYRLAYAAGHTPLKALEIAIEYERGNAHAVRWVAALLAAAS